MTKLFDPKKLKLESLQTRSHLMDISAIMALENKIFVYDKLKAVAENIHSAKENNRPVILMIGAHVIRAGVQHYIIDMINKGFIDCIAMNGAGIVHDFELALIGATTESVAKYIQTGQFGLWQETGELNNIINAAAKENMGMGAAVGKYISEHNLPHSDISLCASAWQMGCPVTVHVGIGQDIIHEHPNFDGAACGKTSYHDFLKFTSVLDRLEGGVIMNFGSAVMGPEVFLKALSMVRNIARQEHRDIKRFTTLVCDLVDLPDDYSKEASKNTPGYYFRPWKTMLVRTVADGGKSFYVKGDHRETIPQLWTALI